MCAHNYHMLIYGAILGAMEEKAMKAAATTTIPILHEESMKAQAMEAKAMKAKAAAPAPAMKAMKKGSVAPAPKAMKASDMAHVHPEYGKWEAIARSTCIASAFRAPSPAHRSLCSRT